MNTLKKFLTDIKKYDRYVIYSAKAFLKAEVADSYLNWFWWILDPLLNMVTYAFLSVVIFKSNEPDFGAFIFIGLIVWGFFEANSLSCIVLVRNNRDVVTKIYVPKFVLVLQRLYINGFKMMIGAGLLALLLVFYHVPFNLSFIWGIPCLITLFLIAFGVGVLFLHYGVFVNDLFNAMQAGFRILFFMSGIFYSVQASISGPFGVWMTRLNPIALIIQSLRECLLYHTVPQLGWLAAWAAVGVCLGAVGVNVIYKYENSYSKVI